MQIQIIESMKEKLNVIIYCKKIDEEVLKLKAHIELFNRRIYAKKNEDTYFVNIADVLYFESIDNRTFLYTRDDVYEVKQRLYELEDCLADLDFIRISKSFIVNINQIQSLKPELNRTLIATMCNGEILIISRKYVPTIRQLLSI